MACKNESFYPETLILGHLPEKPTHETPKSFAIPSKIPADAKSLLLYAFATTAHETSFQRGYFEIFTQEGDTKYKMYMNFATGTAAAVTITSANVWLPITSERKVHVSLVYPKDVCVAHKEKTPVPKNVERVTAILCGEEWSNLFITGWK